MLSEPIKNEIRSLFNTVKKEMPKYKNRPAQNKMIAEISKTLAGEYSESNPIICIEAPTGIGKTMAYLLATIPIAKAKNKKIIISSATVALQEQIMYKDIVDIQKYCAQDFKYTLAKGRSRYLCIRNLTNLLTPLEEQNVIFEEPLWGEPPNKKQIQLLQTLEQEYSTKRWNGEIDDLKLYPDFNLWQKICCNRFSCSAKNCQFYNDCSFFESRRQISKADIIITNHDLVLSDILNGNLILPKIQDCIFIFDEAHHLTEKSLSHFASNCSIEFIKTTIHKTDNILERISKIKIQNKVIDEILSDLNDILSSIEYDNDIHLFDLYKIDDNILNNTKKLAHNINIIFDDFCKAKENWKESPKRKKLSIVEKENINIINADIEQSLLSIITLLEKFNEQMKLPNPPSSNWIEKSKLINKKNNYNINSAKIDVSNYLDKNIWSEIAGAVLTSATLTTLGNFNRINNQLGLDKNKNKYLRLSSAFNHQLVEFIVAKMNFSPKDVYGHTNELAKELKKRINPKEATLVLFASNAQMQKVADLIEEEIQCSILLQGQFNKKTIIEKHKKLRNKGSGSIIFGLDSFAEGIDLKGNNLNHVMIAKLRFNVPTSPIEKTKYSYLESIGKNSFMEISLPYAYLKLIQACGRLIRTEQDSGKITIFDKRITEKFYGKYLLNNLPKYKLTIEK